MDTKATVLFREGKLDDAIDLESAAMSLTSGDVVMATQLDRFLSKKQEGSTPVVEGAAPVPALTWQPPLLKLDFAGAMPYGGKVLVRFSGAAGALGVLEVDLGASHGASYQASLPQVPKDARADLAFADSRGCDVCKVGSSRSFFAKHDKEIDSYP